MDSDNGIRHAAIVAGGFGTRARQLTGDVIPKALLPVDGIPIIIRQMRVLAREGIRHVAVLGGHLGSQLETALRPEAQRLGLTLDIVIEAAPLGTAGCLTALGQVSAPTFIVYGDMLFDMDLAALARYQASHPAELTVIAHPNDHPRTSDIVVEAAGYVRRILPRKEPRDGDWRNLVPAGLYLAAPAFFADLQPGVVADMIHDRLPALLAVGRPVGVYNTPEYIRDVGTPERHAAAERDLRSGRVAAMHLAQPRPAIFFDCDGVLNADPGGHGVVAVDQVQLLPDAAEAVRIARDYGFFAIGATNRPQVAKGLITMDDLQHILGRLEAELAVGRGVLDRIYFCPHHPERGFPGEVPELKIRCGCRKPGSLMLETAAGDLPIDMTRSAIIGDSLRDIGAARRAGIWAYGVRTGHGCRDIANFSGSEPPQADMMFDTVLDAVDFQCRYRAMAEPVLRQLASWPWSTSGRPALVALCGRSRAGKSTLGHAIQRVAAESGAALLRVELDRWILPLDQRPPGASAEMRNQVAAYRTLIESLRAGRAVEAPGYDVASRGGGGGGQAYDPSGAGTILLEGVFASHPSIRDLIDLAVFVESPEDRLHQRFRRFYAWKGLAPEEIASLWSARTSEEWPAVDSQRQQADMILTLEQAES